MLVILTGPLALAVARVNAALGKGRPAISAVWRWRLASSYTGRRPARDRRASHPGSTAWRSQPASRRATPVARLAEQGLADPLISRAVTAGLTRPAPVVARRSALVLGAASALLFGERAIKS
jgi:hypothetical protein